VRIALIHYHLRRGGVTSVLYNQANALAGDGDEVLIITGEANPNDTQIPQAVVEELRYNQAIPKPGAEDEYITRRAEALADGVIAAMKAHWGGSADILHVHNPMIRKNIALLTALDILRKRGLRLLLQNHDLSEDFRPDVYVGDEEYPENCHYAVINKRDYSFLRRAGLKSEGLHLLPNEVHPIEAAQGLERRRYLYPVRAIRRKNIGEALLLSLFIQKGKVVAITLPPASEKEIPAYRKWMDFAREIELPVEFEIGLQESLADAYGSALGIITTSVKEGFGFSFLEPWTAGRAVIGRRIDYVCRDFENSGVRFKTFYSSIDIPRVYISTPIFRKKLEETMTTIYQSFGQEPPQYMLSMMREDLLSRSTADFGRLDEVTQAGIIRVVKSNQAVYQDIAAANPFLAGLADWKPDEEWIEVNRRIILEHYGREQILKTLKEIYRMVLHKPVIHKISKTMLLELYLDPLRLSLVGASRD
jgi:glycosyltransferase involved in cell wall biosynthesis